MDGNLDDPNSQEEVEQALPKLANGKATGQAVLPPELRYLVPPEPPAHLQSYRVFGEETHVCEYYIDILYRHRIMR